MTEHKPCNYIFFFPGDYYPFVFGDVSKNDNACYLKIEEGSFLTVVLKKFALTPKLPLLLRLPFVWIMSHVYCSLFRTEINKLNEPGNPVCFIFDRRMILFLKNYMYTVLKRRFPKSKVVIFFTDLIGLEKVYERILQQNNLDKCYDLVYSYDPSDAERYHILFHNLPMMDLTSIRENKEETCDVLFLGRAKDRIHILVRIYEVLTARGLLCEFYLVDTPEDQKMEIPKGIHLCDWIPYEEYLKMAVRSKILLEIVQGNSQGNTLRVGEAILLGKKLLSNRKGLLNNPLYDPAQMYVLEDVEQIPDEFLFGETKGYSEELKEKLSLEVFLADIENDLNRLDDEE